MKKKNSEQSKTLQEFVESKDNSDFLVKDINDSIFKLLVKDDKVNIIIGNHLATEKKFESEEEALEYAENPSWDLILNTIIFLIKNIKDL